MNGEHSMMDGMPVVGYCDFITKRSYHDALAESSAKSSAGYERAEDNVKDIFADCTGELTSASSNVGSHVEKCELSMIS